MIFQKCSVRFTRSLNDIVSFNFLLLNVDEKEKWFLVGLLSVWSLPILPMSMWVFSRDSSFLHMSQICMWGQWACRHCPSVSVDVCDVPHDGRMSCPMCIPPGALNCQDSLQLPCLWTEISGLEKDHLTCFYSSFLKVHIARIYFNV